MTQTADRDTVTVISLPAPSAAQQSLITWFAECQRFTPGMRKEARRLGVSEAWVRYEATQS